MGGHRHRKGRAFGGKGRSRRRLDEGLKERVALGLSEFKCRTLLGVLQLARARLLQLALRLLKRRCQRLDPRGIVPQL